MRYWVKVASRAWKDTRRAAKIETTEAIVLLVAGQAIVAGVLWYWTGDASPWTRFATVLLPFLLLPPIFLMKFVATPSVLAREAEEHRRTTERELNAKIESLTRNTPEPNSQMERLLETISELVARLVPEQKPATTQIPSHLQDLRTLPADTIRARVHDITHKMRQIETAFKNSRSTVIFGPREDWEKHTNQMLAQGQEQMQRWQSELMPEAVALWNELRRRIYDAPPYPRDQMAAVALEHGMLAGVSPLNDAAIALERLAREMPG